MRVAKPVLFVLVVVASQGCLRYVPSQRDLASGVSSGELGGQEEFLAVERRRDEQLQSLLRDRAPYLDVAADNSYLVGQGDVIELDVFGLPELKAEHTVSPRGLISPSLVGELKVEGLTVAQLREKLQSGYAQYVKHPQIRVGVKEFRGHQVSVVGAVEKPGLFPLLQRGELLTEVLSRAGGRASGAGSTVIIMPNRRGAGSAIQTAMQLPAGEGIASGPQDGRGIEVDIDDLYGGVDKSPLLIPLVGGDIVIVPEAGTVEVDGEVNKPGSYKLSSKLSTLGAVAAAGGLTYSANVKDVEVIRDVGNGRKAVVSVDLEQLAFNGQRDVRLRNGDVVRVTSSPGLFVRRQLVEALNGFFRFGVSSSVRY